MPTRQKAEWPENSAKKVQEAAEEHEHKGALDTLFMIRDLLFGNADRMEELAVWWGQAWYMVDSETAIDDSRNNLAAYWQGGGYDSYNTYAINATKRISRNEGVFNEIAGTMESCIDIVYETYADAIKFISECANQIADATSNFLEDLINPFGEAGNIIRVLNGFVQAISDLVEDSVRKMGDLRQMGVFLARQANDFSDVKKMAEPAGNADLWAVKPVPKEPAAAQ
ncbi:hypothetical protein [Amycolatopsis regifaucium]|uniref:Uncharacterized protein n=1 Tax=Amycolatopsis regifaucium TaxID=546365 RepID=A0A154M443_9PSEU|nr:hypothetical protein [Amycolatopsis regifaucium]KZB79394.1 hypothetical protein AVL48_17575 [Amycolatopsis regifaucium]OKA07576.1 hypothetical protein ATP06_0217260 [Amycolatopsis regifaucium]SFH07952.1 hypothetical protein SAMN04489731_102361 [Amycolatopsis regifaucium]